MQIKQTLVRLLVFVLPVTAFGQTTFLPLGSAESHLLERLEIKAMKDSVLNFSKTKPYSREQFIPQLALYYQPAALRDSGAPAETVPDARLTSIDQRNIERAFAISPEWAPFPSASRRPVGRFYRNPANLYEASTEDFYLSVNPVFQYIVGAERNSDDHIFLNTRGLTLRGRIADKVGFAAYVTDNQERDPYYVREWVTAHRAVPGAGFYKEFKTTGYDYFDARGYVTAGITRFIDVAFGYDRHFIGNGHRSLFLSDFSNSALFLKLNTRIWKFNYQNLFLELNTAHRLNADQLFPKKYAAMHHLDLAVTKWLNVGLFEAIVFGRNDHFEFGYLNPVIFYRSIEQQTGSFDNALAGIDFKANAARRFQFYGQMLLDEFVLKEIKDNKGWWANKFGYQLGAKYVDALGINNLDLQLEMNRVRPFTYSHRDSVANYTHYNQPLAHPLGASFHEWIGIMRYQPLQKLMVQLKAITFAQGRDTGKISYGGNIFLPNIPPYRNSEYGYEIGSGEKARTGYMSALLSYELRPNLFVEGNAVLRTEKLAGVRKTTSVVYLGIRWNMHRREFEF
ncbi:MAG TPA: hypothetical protein VFZ78_01825 [Flavisolibacter sp.]